MVRAFINATPITEYTAGWGIGTRKNDKNLKKIDMIVVQSIVAVQVPR
jgi:hypothetical protein